MRILLVHNAYLQRGGEDAVFEAERDLLAARGHDIFELRLTNEATDRMSRIRLAARALYSLDGRRTVAGLVREHEVEVVHFHNTQPMVSPAAFGAARKAGAAVVHTLHNYRLACPSATLFRGGRACTDCVGKVLALPAIRHRCYRNSRAATAVVACGTALHRALGTWRNDVDAYIALTTFQRDLLVRTGLPKDRIAIVPNFLVRDPGSPGGGARRGVLFVGRLAEEKGVRTLLAAVRHLPAGLNVRFVGAGPLGAEVARAALTDPRIVPVGVRNREDVLAEMRRAAVLAVPSLWFEGMPMTIVEAFACGLPAVVSRIGGLPGLVRDGIDGGLARPGDPQDLARAITAIATDRGVVMRMSTAARETYFARFAADAHHDALMTVYGAAIGARHGGSPLALPEELSRPAAAESRGEPEVART